jgi:three-Cys-motif partner protein
VSDYEIRRGLESDGLYTPSIKRHSLAKIELHNRYASAFAKATSKSWPQRAYLGLYSGAGRARVDESGEIVETTALSVFRLEHQFTHHIFVDSDDRCIDALDARIRALGGGPSPTLITGNVLDAIPRVVQSMPRFDRNHGLLSLCFIDPFAADLDFRIIKELGTRFRMDFLVLLMLGRDIRTNFLRYYDDPDDSRIAALIDDPRWRDEWAARGHNQKGLIRFLLEKFDQAMTRIGYQPVRPEESHPIRLMSKNVFLYSLVLYSKDPLGQKLWEASRSYASPQLPLTLDG